MPIEPHSRLHFLTTWSIRPEGGGVGMSIRNTIAALETLGVVVDLPLASEAPDWAMIQRRLSFNDALRIPDESPCLCIDWDGLGIVGMRAGGRNPKIVHVRTNFDDIRTYESGVVGDQCRRMNEYLQRNLATADGVVVSSRYTAERIRGSLADDVPLCIANNGLDVELAARLNRQTGVEPEPGLIVALGTFHRRKSFDTVIRASQWLHAQGVRHRLLVAGDGPERERLQALAAPLPHIELIPFVKDTQDLAALYGRASVVCHPALQEDFGNVYIEAGAAGRPIVAARAGAASELVLDGMTGHLHPPGDWCALAEILRDLLRDEETGRRLGAQARVHVARFTWSRSASTVLQFIRSIEESRTTRQAAVLSNEI